MPYWTSTIKPNSDMEWFLGTMGVCLGGLALMNYNATEKEADLCTAVNLWTNAGLAVQAFKGLTNNDGNPLFFQIQNVVGLGMLAMSAMVFFG